MPDYYKILGVSKEADAVEIKKAYRRAAVKYHPDKNPGDDKAEAKFKQIAEAYETLGNDTKKKEYDNPNRFAQGMHGGFNPFDIFNSMNRPHQRPQNRPIRGKDLHVVVPVSLYTLCFGGKETFTVSYDTFCEVCKGRGATEFETCSECGGQGVFMHTRTMGNMTTSSSTPCQSCRGLGQKSIDKCSECGGEGVIKVTNAKFSINIPKNTRDGAVNNMIGVGPIGLNGGSNGNIVVRLEMRKPDIDKLSEEEIEILKKL